MLITVNGEGWDVGDGSTVADLLRLVGIDAARAAVERNGRIVPRAGYERTRLAAGDRLEVVTFVAGG